MGALRPGARAVSPLCAGGLRRHRPAGWRRRNHVNVAEIWSYHTIGDQTRFTLVHRGRRHPARRAPAPRDARASRPSAAGRAANVARRGHARKAGRRPRRKPRTKRRKSRSRSADAEKEVGPADASVQPRQARLREHLRRPPPPRRRNRGRRASFTGSGRRPEFASVARPSTRTRSA